MVYGCCSSRPNRTAAYPRSVPGKVRKAHVAKTAAVPQSTVTVIERRAADVLIIGRPSLAIAAAYSLAKRGQKVIVLPDFGLIKAGASADRHKPLHLPHYDESLISLGVDAAAYWRGLQAQSGTQLYKACGSMCVGRSLGSGAASEMLGRLQDACRTAGVKVKSMRPDEVAATMPSVRLPSGFSGLFQEHGALLDVAAVDRALLALAERAGVLVRDRLVLRGWRDEGSHFSVRASSSVTPTLESVFEAERLLLVPGAADWLGDWERLFGLTSNVEVRAVSALSCQVGSGGATGLPVLQHLGGLEPLSDEAPGVGSLGRCWVHPPAQASGRTLQVLQGPSDGLLLRGSGSAPGAVGGQQASSLPAPNRLASQQLHRMASTLVRDVGGLQGSSQSTLPACCTSDGWPLLGRHPAFEEGRAFVACCTSGGEGGGWDGYQLTPLLAKMASELAQGGTPQDVDMARLSPARTAINMAATQLHVDTWGELTTLQRPPGESPYAAAAAADAAEDMRRSQKQ